MLPPPPSETYDDDQFDLDTGLAMSISFNEVLAVPEEVGEKWSAEEYAREHGIPYVGEHDVKVKADQVIKAEQIGRAHV